MTCESNFGIPTQQLTELVIENHDALAANAQLDSEIVQSEGYGALHIIVISNVPGTVLVEERATCGAPDAEDPQPDGVVTQRVSTVFDTETGRWFVATVIPIAGAALLVSYVNGAFNQSYFQIKAYLLPVSGGACSGGGGSGDAGGPGTVIATKADQTVAAAVETNVISGSDIPAGSMRVTLKNVGSNSVRIKPAGFGGGATAGMELAAGEAMSVGTSLGALAPLDAYSTTGTTLCFLFERE